MTLWPRSTVRVSGEFLNKDTLEGIDPGNITLRVLRPDGIPYVGAIIEHDGPGHYHADILIDQSGRWQYRWSAGQVGDEGEFQAEASAFV
jgi:hypothetical protein